MTDPTPSAPGAPGGSPPASDPAGGGSTPTPPDPSGPPATPTTPPTGTPGTPADGTRREGRADPNDTVTDAARAAVAGDKDTPGSTKAGDWRVTDLPDGAQKLIGDLRAEAAQNRTGAKDATAKADELQKKLDGFITGFAQVLGLTEEPGKPEPPDPAKLTAELESRTRAHNEALTKIAVYEAAGAHGANPKALVDSVSFLAKVNKFDPAADDFADQVDEAVAEAVASNPIFKAAGPAPAAPKPPSGGEFSGRPAGPRDVTSLSVDDFRKQLTESRRA